MDPDAPWMMDDDTTDNNANENSEQVEGSTEPALSHSGATIISGPPVPNPYAHVLDVPCKKRQYTHWARPTYLQYKYLHEYLLNYYDDYIDYMDKRQRGLYREKPRPQEWAERSFKVNTRDGRRLTKNDFKYWFTDKNVTKPKCSIFHAVHSKDYYNRQYKQLLS